MKDSFWSRTALATQDHINDSIWSRSPELQRQIQPPSTLEAPNAVGAQQAMVPGAPDIVLPWVPDLVGAAWLERDALLVAGSAYAGFLAGCSGRGRCLSVDQYRGARTWCEFLRRFVESVVCDDPNYYGPLARLVAKVTGRPDATALGLFDLCRASFVRRGDGVPRRTDSSNDFVVRGAADLFDQYVQAGAEWTWRRLNGGAAVRVVALGTIAEHGLLRLWSRQGAVIRHSRTGTLWTGSAGSDGKWVARYADPRYKLASWLETASWWEITSAFSEKTWRLLPVSHPARSQHDPQYDGAAAVLTRML